VSGFAHGWEAEAGDGENSERDDDTTQDKGALLGLGKVGSDLQVDEPAGNAAGDEVRDDANANAGSAVDTEGEGTVLFPGELSDSGRQDDGPNGGDEAAEKCESQQDGLGQKECARGRDERNAQKADEERFTETEPVDEESGRERAGDGADVHSAGHGAEELFVEAAVEEEEVVKKEEDEETEIEEERGSQEGPEGAGEACGGDLVANAAIKKGRKAGETDGGA